MANLPVITGFGGINPAGRSSSHHAYRRLVLDALGSAEARQTRISLASLMGLLHYRNGQWQNPEGTVVELESFLTRNASVIENSTLIRQLENNLFDPQRLLFHRRLTMSARDQPLEFEIRQSQMPGDLPPGWQVISDPATAPGHLKIRVESQLDVMLAAFRNSPVNSAGQLPSGFDPEVLYASRNHPRGLQLTIYGASDAINSLGIDWQTVTATVAPDRIAVYAGSGMSQLDYNGNGGMMQARLLGKKVSSKQLALGYAEMPADFVNAYVLGNFGTTGTNVAACATFLYNLRQAARDIQNGSHRVAIVGTSEAPLVPEIIDGFSTMGALADDDALMKLDGLQDIGAVNYRRACRPFGNNVGFTLAESAQFVVLFDDALALELGANIYGAVNEVFINADGFKKSIASPGLGNYISMAKATAATRNLIGDKALRKRSFVQAHGTGTPQNRVTESQILSEIAATFGINSWPVTAVKSYLGHSLASSAGDQLVSSLGLWRYGIIPGIRTVDQIADDVCSENLDILLQHRETGREGMDAVIINSKGFGGNNASASILAPHLVTKMLGKKYGKAQLSRYREINETVRSNTDAYDDAAITGQTEVIYRFDHNVLQGESLDLNRKSMKIQGIEPAINLDIPNSYADMCD
ncbi:MAG: beta-ketoacyl synthase [Pseudohongiellaceae bacterium]